MAVLMQPSLMCIEEDDVERSEKNVLLMGDQIETRAELENKPNLFLGLVAWRQLGFNALKIPWRLQMDTWRHFPIHIQLHRMSEKKASNARTTFNGTEINEHHVFPVGLRLKLEQ